MHLAGVSLTSPALILRCSELAAVRSRKVVEIMKSKIKQDSVNREHGILPKGFAESIELSKIPVNFHNEEPIAVFYEGESSGTEQDSENQKPVERPLSKMDSKTVATIELGESSSSDDEDMPEAGTAKPKAVNRADDGSNSEEEEIQTLHS